MIFESDNRSGIAVVINRHTVANNPLIPYLYEARELNMYILYTNGNNMYGAAMSQQLPCVNFRCLDQNVNVAIDFVYIMIIDLHFLGQLHDFYLYYTLALVR